MLRLVCFTVLGFAIPTLVFGCSRSPLGNEASGTTGASAMGGATTGAAGTGASGTGAAGTGTGATGTGTSTTGTGTGAAGTGTGGTGATGTAMGCDIGGTVYASGAVSPSDPCFSCVPSMSTTGWTAMPGGTGCGSVCCAGSTPACVALGKCGCGSQADCPPNEVCDTSTGLCGSPVAPGTVTFNETGTPQTFVVPAGVTHVTVVANGAPGDGCGTGPVGKGGTTTATIPVTPGETLVVMVGGIGKCGGSGGYNGGGPGGSGQSPGGDGGGASDVRQGGVGLANRVVVAGGGGGSNGGNGGGMSGAPGGSGQSGAGGGGGTQSSGGEASLGCGLGPTTCEGGAAGALGQGGAGGPGCGTPIPSGGGGGGGGYYGGGGGGGYLDGACGGGGGGSSYVTPKATGVTMQPGAWGLNGQVVISWS